MKLLVRLLKRLVIILPTMYFLYPCLSSAISHESEEENNKFAASISFTLSINTSSSDIENVMRLSGLDYPRHHLFSGGVTTHPYTEMSGLQWMFYMNYDFSYPMSVGLMFGSAPIVRVTGYANPQGGFGTSIKINYSVFTIAPTFIFYVTRGIRLSVGPTYNKIRTYASTEDGGRRSTHTLGYMAEIASKIYLSRDVFVLLNAQYRYVGSADVGPFIEEDVVGIINPTPSVIIITFPKTIINFNHWLIGLGIGMEF